MPRSPTPPRKHAVNRGWFRPIRALYFPDGSVYIRISSTRFKKTELPVASLLTAFDSVSASFRPSSRNRKQPCPTRRALTRTRYVLTLPALASLGVSSRGSLASPAPISQ